MCINWVNYRTSVDQETCDNLANVVNELVDQQAYSLAPDRGFVCTRVNTTTATMTICGDFSTSVDATGFGRWLSQTGFENVIAPLVDFGNGVGVVNGRPVCLQSVLSYQITDSRTGRECRRGQFTSTCRPEVPDQFPYCDCTPWNISRTPYDVTFR